MSRTGTMPPKRPRRHSKTSRDSDITEDVPFLERGRQAKGFKLDGEHGEKEEEHDHVTSLSQNPFMQMFSSFRDEIDEHHDRRERIIKTSRDITASSKKLIFTLQRIRSLDQPLPPYINREFQTRLDQINNLFSEISTDLQGMNAYRYQRNISAGIQEFMEAISFHHYITTAISSKEKAEQQGRLLTISEAQKFIPGGIELTIADYMGGIFDFVGELMKLAITIIATSPLSPPSPPISQPGNNSSSSGGSSAKIPPVLEDLREVRSFFENLDTARGSSTLGKEVEKKFAVMRTCVNKVEMAVYSVVVRGRERPAGWLPEVEVDVRGRDVED